MLDLERVNAEIEKSGKKDRLKSLADSAEGRAVSRMLDPAAVEKAAKRKCRKRLRSR